MNYLLTCTTNHEKGGTNFDILVTSEDFSRNTVPDFMEEIQTKKSDSGVVIRFNHKEYSLTPEEHSIAIPFGDNDSIDIIISKVKES